MPIDYCVWCREPTATKHLYCVGLGRHVHGNFHQSCRGHYIEWSRNATSSDKRTWRRQHFGFSTKSEAERHFRDAN